MSNGPAHRIGSVVIVGTIAAIIDNKRHGELTWRTPAAASLAWAAATLPDVLEPANHPNHRQFFHSMAFASLLSYGMIKLKEWETHDEHEQNIKDSLLITGSSYLVHLGMDSLTPKGLPII